MYQIYPKEVSMWCEVPLKDVLDIFNKFQNDKKIFYKDGWIKILNHKKYQNYGGGTQQIAYEKELQQVPNSIIAIDVDTSIDTSIDTSMHTTYNIEKRNQKQEIITHKQENSRSFLIENRDSVLNSAIGKYPDKNCVLALEDFVEATAIKDYKYKDYKLAFFNWVRTDRFGKYSKINKSVHGTKTTLGIV